MRVINGVGQINHRLLSSSRSYRRIASLWRIGYSPARATIHFDIFCLNQHFESIQGIDFWDFRRCTMFKVYPCNQTMFGTKWGKFVFFRIYMGEVGVKIFIATKQTRGSTICDILWLLNLACSIMPIVDSCWITWIDSKFYRRKYGRFDLYLIQNAFNWMNWE